MKRKRNETNLQPDIKQLSFRESVEQDEQAPPRKKTKKEPSKSNRNVQLEFEQQESEEQPYSFGNAMRKTYDDYCIESSIHGSTYLNHSHHIAERIFWLFLILTSLVLCIALIKIQYDKWQERPVIISFSDTPTAVSQIPFPALTICTETKNIKDNNIDFAKFYEALKAQKGKLIERPADLTDEQFLKMRTLLQVCGSSLVKNMRFPDYPPYDIIKYLNQVTAPFEKGFVFCSFNQTTGPCSPLFEKIYTEEGICYTFNAFNETELYRNDTFQYKLFSKDKTFNKRARTLDWNIANGYIEKHNYDTYPERVMGCGIKTGLIISLRASENDEDYICRSSTQGFKLILHSPDDVPNVDKSYIQIPYEREFLILIKPHYVFTTKDIDHYSPERRNCYYPEERHLKFFQFYTQNNCEMECLANFTLRGCGCVKFSMPRLADTSVCDLSKIHCYEKAESDFLLSEYTVFGNEDEKCQCLPGCYTLDYDYEISQGVLDMKRVIEAHDDPKYTAEYQNAKISRITVYFQANEFTAWKRSEVYGLADFLANCGGLFGLFIGFSILSMVELFYHFTVRLHRNVRLMKSAQNN